MKVDAPCPECGHTPADVLAMLDGKIWLCPACGHQEFERVADEDAAIDELAGHDPELIEAWRQEIGLPPKQ